MVDDISAFKLNDSRVYFCSFLPTHFVGIKNIGSKTNETIVICHERINIVTVTNIRLITLLITPESVAVNACWAPITSELIREIRAPV